MNTWQSINTAPKDGTWFWGYVDGDALRMRWHAEFEAFVTSWRQMTMAPGYRIENDEGEWVGEYDHSPEIEHPDYWMPSIEPGLE